MKVNRTVVRFDFVGSKKVTDDLDCFAGTDAIRGFTNKIEELRNQALQKAIPNYQLNEILLREEGDGHYLIFDNVNHAHNFAHYFLCICNTNCWPFRMGAATGEIDQEQDKQTVGKKISDAARLESYGAEAGCFCIDQETYNCLCPDLKKQYKEKLVEGKIGEREITAWYCQMIAKEKLNFPDEHNTPTAITTDTGLKLLRSLNYSTNENYFKQLMNLQEVAFLVQEQNVRVQNWLIERLIYHVPNSIDARKYLIDFQSYALSSSVEYFWHEFKDISTEENPTVTSIVDNLASLCQNKTIIIIMRKLNFLDQETINKIFDFWDDLVNKVRLSQNRKVQSRLVLLLVEESKEYNKLRTLKKDKFNFINPTENKINQMLKSKRTQSKDIFLLSPMKSLPRVDVQNWLQKTEISSSLKIDAQYMDTLLNKIIPCWEEVPENVINNICETIFKFTDGIAEIEPMWRW
ncbi:MAG: hypothetical protein HEQ13_22470 [Dolichospermum sp. DEX189]|jgi:hypothetical protein|uniref:Inactive STAND domain-containing protein n=1 Tax=Aphanizomenon flos-aquae FACHB-1040 TaxID=2692887 RepID=A0ABR8C2D2_APHFL|nr:hypothetical protein [Aphanizomenon flos-aquae]MBD2280191.1 hypothetical protein [Aphanizomenon flos-aquae FACHB-1040]MBO1071949.1 hypothetical protein [Dolichospermum sp. DEX189]